ncbi:MarC family protein [Kribbella sp. NPDC048915]|uniref:MarC family protein n=1 Tax=Kribbella sp. NPDC048915 TaxID=3155148 RepID=UPI0033E3ABDF
MSSIINFGLLSEVVVTLFVIMDPPGTVPVFISLTAGQSRAVRKKAAWQAVLVAFGVIVVFAAFGQQILHHLGITLPALQAAGGLLLLLIALQLLTDTAEDPVQTKNVNIAFVPLGTPLLAGPGAIVATMVFVQRAEGSLPDVVAISVGIVLIHLVMWLTLRFSGIIMRILGENGVLLVTRIAGLLLSAIAVQLVADAVTDFIKAG